MSSGSPQGHRARKRHTRSLSAPYFHSWTYGNVDLSHQLFINPHQTIKQVIRAKAQARARALFARTPTFAGQSPNASHLLQLTKPTKQQSAALAEALNLLEYRKELAQERGDKGRTIVSGSRRALVLALFDEHYASTDHLEVFVYTHLAWLSASTLLHYFLGIWKSGLSSIFPLASESHRSVVCSPEATVAVRSRIMEVIHMWIESCPADFKSHHAGAMNRTNHVHHELQQFLFTIMEAGASLECSMAELVLGTLNLAVRPNQPMGGRTASVSLASSTSSQSAARRNHLRQLQPEHLEVLDMGPYAWAIQMTLCEFNAAKLLAPEHFATTQPAPMLKRKYPGSTAPSRETSAEPQTPGTAGRNAIADAIERTQRFTGWVSTEIVTCPSSSARTVVLGNFIEIAHTCYELRNYQSAYSIYSGISKSYVTRLSETWRALSAEHMYWWSKLSVRFSNLIDLFDECIEAPHPKIMPLIPTLQLLAQQQVLKDVAKRGHWINFSKFRGICQIVKPVILAQQIAYPFAEQVIPTVQVYLEQHLLCLPSATLLRFSQDIEQGAGPSMGGHESASDEEDPFEEPEDVLERQNSNEGFVIRPLGQMSRSKSKDLYASTPHIKLRHPSQNQGDSIPQRPSFVLKSPPVSPPRQRPPQQTPSNDAVTHNRRTPSTEDISDQAQTSHGATSPNSAILRRPPITSTTIVETPDVPHNEIGTIGTDHFGRKSQTHLDLTSIAVKSAQLHHHGVSTPDSYSMHSTDSASSLSSASSYASSTVSTPVPSVVTTAPSEKTGAAKPGPDKPSKAEGEVPRDKTLKDLHGEVKAKWTRPWSQCSVGADLPRFVRKTVVIQEGTNEIVFHGGGERDDQVGAVSARGAEAPLPELIGNLLKAFATVLEAKKELKAIEKSLDLYFAPKPATGAPGSSPPSFDLAKETDRFCREILGESARVTSLLKVAASQGIVAPAWMKLRLFILSRFGFKDVKKGWNIAVIVGESRVVVVHRKREASNEETTGHPDFEFTWEMRVVFSKKLDKLESASFAITNVAVSPNMPDKKLTILKSTILDWFLPGSDLFPKDVFPGPQLIPNATVLGNSPRDAPTSKKDKKRKSFGAVAREWFAGRHPFKGNDSSTSSAHVSPAGSSLNLLAGSAPGSGTHSPDSLMSPPNSSRSKLNKSSKSIKSGGGVSDGITSPASTHLSFNTTTMIIPSTSSTTSPYSSAEDPRRAKLVRRLSDSSSETYSISRKSSFTEGPSTPTTVKKSRHRSGEPNEARQQVLTATTVTVATPPVVTASPAPARSPSPPHPLRRATSTQVEPADSSPAPIRRSRRGSEASSNTVSVSVYFPGTATVSFGTVDYGGGASSDQLKSSKKSKRRSSEGKRVKDRSKSIESQEIPSPEIGGGSAATGSSSIASHSTFAQLYRQVSGEVAHSESSFGGALPRSSSGHRSPVRSSSSESVSEEAPQQHNFIPPRLSSSKSFHLDGSSSKSSSSASMEDLEWSTDSGSIGSLGASSPSLSITANRHRSPGRRRALSIEGEGREASAVVNRGIIKMHSSAGSSTHPHIPRSPSSPPPLSSPLLGTATEMDTIDEQTPFHSSPTLFHPASAIPFNVQSGLAASQRSPHSNPSTPTSNSAAAHQKRRLDHAPSSSSHLISHSGSNSSDGGPPHDGIVRTGSKEGLPRKKSVSSRDSPANGRAERKEKEKRKSKNLDEETH
jgi:hypothetical protein